MNTKLTLAVIGALSAIMAFILTPSLLRSSHPDVPGSIARDAERPWASTHNLGRHAVLDTKETTKVTVQASAHSELEKYISGMAGSGTIGREAIDTIHAMGLEKTLDNVTRIRSALSMKISEGERASLLRLLASLYDHTAGSPWNSMILHDLRTHIPRGGEVGRMAALQFSRIGYFPDSLAVLEASVENKSLGKEEYSGELAHLLPFAPSQEQKKILSMLKGLKEAYGAEIIASQFSNPNHAPILTPPVLEATARFLLSMEPEFPMEVGRYGMTDALKYAQWLHATASCVGKGDPAAYDAFIIATLERDSSDPRKAIAYLSADESAAFQQRQHGEEKYAALKERAKMHALQNPANLVMQEAMNSFSQRSHMQQPR